MPAFSIETAIRCPECNSADTKDTSLKWNERFTRCRRYRKCNECGCNFRTTQTRELVDNCGRIWNARPQTPRGEAHQNAVFTEQNIRDMREEYETGGVIQKDLAEKYGVAPRTIWAIVNRKTWAHVE